MSELWQRFTVRVKEVIIAAQDEAARMGEPCLTPEHLLIGLLSASDSLAAKVLERLGVSTRNVLEEMERQIGCVEHGAVDKDLITLSPRVKRVLDFAYDDLRRAKGYYFGTEHLLVGLMREAEGVAFNALTTLGVTLATVRKEIANCLGAGNSDAPEAEGESL